MSTPKKTRSSTAAKAPAPGIAEQPVSHVEWVERATLSANDYNPNSVAPIELDLLALSILEDGWTQPIVAGPDDVIVDGFHRWTVAERPEIAALTAGLVPVVRVAKDRAERMLATIRHNRARGVHGVRPMGSIVQELLGQGMDGKEIMRRLGMESEEVERLSDQAGMPGQIARKQERFGVGWVPRSE